MKLSDHLIGVDESGKGDFFGPLVVAGVLAGPEDTKLFDELYVRDSKKISDKRILEIDAALRATLTFEIVLLMPAEYNALHKRVKNLNIMLAECHARAIIGAHAQAESQGSHVVGAISDKFGKSERLETALSSRNCRLNVKQMVRGEKIPQVAAASIVARAEFVRQMQALSEEYDLVLPKGAAPAVDQAGRRLVAKFGPEVLERIAKTHFKNFSRAMAGDLFG